MTKFGQYGRSCGVCKRKVPFKNWVKVIVKENNGMRIWYFHRNCLYDMPDSIRNFLQRKKKIKKRI